MKMNRKNIQVWVDVLKRVDERGYKFDITDWSRSYGTKKSEAEHHKCGTVACAAGWLAVSQEFIDFGGSSMEYSGSPIFKGKSGSAAIAEFIGVDVFLAKDIVGTSINCIDFYGKHFLDITAKDVIDKLQELLDGDEDGN